jgi:hypothetical protein
LKFFIVLSYPQSDPPIGFLITQTNGITPLYGELARDFCMLARCDRPPFSPTVRDAFDL